MSRRVTGILIDPNGAPIPGATLRFSARSTSLPGVPHGAHADVTTDADGGYDVTLAEGLYRITVGIDGIVNRIGDVAVDTGPAVTLPELIGADGVPESLALSMLARIEALEHVPPGGLSGIAAGANVSINYTNPAVPVVSVPGPIDAGTFT